MEDITGWLNGREWAPNTRRMAVLGLRQFFAWCQSSGIRSDDPAGWLRTPHIPPTVARVPTRAQVRDAMTRASESDRWLIRIATTTGLRRSELTRLHSRDLHGSWLTITGKGGRARRLPVPPDVAEHIRACDGWVFDGPHGRYSDSQIGARLLHATGFPPHAMRRFYATSAYRAGHDIHAVQALLGHSSLATTERYLGLDDTDLVDAAAAAWAA